MVISDFTPLLKTTDTLPSFTSVLQLQQCVSRVQFLESSTVGRSIVSKQEARVCDLENKLEFQRGQVKRFEVWMERIPTFSKHYFVFILSNCFI